MERVNFKKLRNNITREINIIVELNKLSKYLRTGKDREDKEMVLRHINSLKSSLKKTTREIGDILDKINLTRPLPQTHVPVAPQVKVKPVKEIPVTPAQPAPEPKKIKYSKKGFVPTELEKITLKRLKKKKKVVVKKKEKKPNRYVKIASGFFYDYATSLIKKGKFKPLRRDLIKANLEFIPANYVSVIFFTTILSFFASIFVFLFFLFFNFGASPPFITQMTENLGIRFLKVFWIMLLIPAGAFLFVYFYPSLEKKSIESKINQELPFATIHMSAISGSMIDPTKIFSIVISTKEYTYLTKEFTKLLNEINIYGYDLVTALRNMAFNSPSTKLSELFNGLATTINSGGNLPEFFEKRSQTLLFEHRLEMEKSSKAAETFMDIYISVVIAAPMILMLLLMMMRISGLGLTLSTAMITLIMVLGVTMVNILFLTFLHLKQPEA
jgi:Flp pilus assembly protein TadB